MLVDDDDDDAIDGTFVDQGSLDATGDDTMHDGLLATDDNVVGDNVAVDDVAGDDVAEVTTPTVTDDAIGDDDSDTDDDAMEEALTRYEGQDAVSTEMRDIDLVEERKVDVFIDTGCGCKCFSGHECSSAFTREHILSIRGQCSAMTRPDLQNVLFGHVMATVKTNSTMERRGHASKERERTWSSFSHEGIMVHYISATCIIYSITGLQENLFISPQYWS